MHYVTEYKQHGSSVDFVQKEVSTFVAFFVFSAHLTLFN